MSVVRNGSAESLRDLTWDGPLMSRLLSDFAFSQLTIVRRLLIGQQSSAVCETSKTSHTHTQRGPLLSVTRDTRRSKPSMLGATPLVYFSYPPHLYNPVPASCPFRPLLRLLCTTTVAGCTPTVLQMENFDDGHLTSRERAEKLKAGGRGGDRGDSARFDGPLRRQPAGVRAEA